MLECDLIMKGGITSGVAYPRAVVGLAKRYRYRRIGGTSAGAIAAVLAAAAEFRRQHTPAEGDANAGFTELADAGRSLGGDLGSLFQPVAALRPLYQVLLAVANAPPERRRVAFARGVLREWAEVFFLTTLLCVIFVVVGSGGWDIAFAALAFVTFPLIIVSGLVARKVLHHLPRHGFGLCSGLTTAQGRADGDVAFTDWIHERIESIAGERESDGPLTIGDLRKYDIELASMTTDLSSGRPWQLPFRAGVHHFSRSEFATLFPADVVEWLAAKGGRSSGQRGRDVPDDLYVLPDNLDMPVLVLARLSLSFPVLVSAVPLYRADADDQDSAADDSAGAEAVLERCWFSDGGISSNFPVHLFDSFLPSRPTFGIAFAPYDATRHGSETSDRVHLPTKAPSGGGRIHPIKGLGGFAGAIVNSAKDWQDTLQSRLPGHAERIVEIRLDPDREGGLHVTMEQDSIEFLEELGELAATRIENSFDFDHHRLQRARGLFATLEQALLGVQGAWPTTAQSGLTYEEVLQGYDQSSREDGTELGEETLADMGRKLVELGREIAPLPDSDVTAAVARKKRPFLDADLRVVASADSSPAALRKDPFA